MKTYQVFVTAYAPYAITQEYREKCWEVETAIVRAIKKFRSLDRIKRKRIQEFSVKSKVLLYRSEELK